MPHRVFRVLSENETPEKGLEPRDCDANITAQSHVHGKKKSQYISATATFKTAVMFASLAVAKGKIEMEDVRIVKIDVSSKEDKDGEEVEEALDIIDLSQSDVLEYHIPKNDKRARNYATKYKEVLVEGCIPAWRIKLVKKEWKMSKKIDVADYECYDDEVSDKTTRYKCL